MTPEFSVQTTTHFDRAFRKLVKLHPELAERYAEAVAILKSDPYNRSRSHPIRKLQGVTPGNAQCRLRLGRFRFRYDVERQVVYLKACALRREAYR